MQCPRCKKRLPNHTNHCQTCGHVLNDEERSVASPTDSTKIQTAAPTMIYCAACEHRCSSSAASCPECGHPLRAQIVPTENPMGQLVEAMAHHQQQPPVVVRPVQQVQTIERTSKKYKAGMLTGLAIMLLSPCGCFASLAIFGKADAAFNASTVVFIACFSVGSVMLLGNKARAWWYHG